MTISQLFINATNMVAKIGKLHEINCDLLIADNDNVTVTSAVIKAIVEENRAHNTYFITYCNGKLRLSEPLWGVRYGNG